MPNVMVLPDVGSCRGRLRDCSSSRRTISQGSLCIPDGSRCATSCQERPGNGWLRGTACGLSAVKVSGKQCFSVYLKSVRNSANSGTGWVVWCGRVCRDGRIAPIRGASRRTLQDGGRKRVLNRCRLLPTRAVALPRQPGVWIRCRCRGRSSAWENWSRWFPSVHPCR